VEGQQQQQQQQQQEQQSGWEFLQGANAEEREEAQMVEGEGVPQ